MTVDRQIAASGHAVRLTAEHTGNGWDVREEIDRTLIHVEHHQDWKHAEWAMNRLELSLTRPDLRRQPLH